MNYSAQFLKFPSAISSKRSYIPIYFSTALGVMQLGAWAASGPVVQAKVDTVRPN
jgi:hypothetical protein